MFSMPLAYPSTLDQRPPVVHHPEEAVLRGGALEPEPRAQSEKNRMLKHTLIHQRYLKRQAPRAFLSQAGPRFDLDFLQAGHHL
jgi:hypothetical protein